MAEHTSPPTGWQLEQRGPEAYEEYLVPEMFEPWAERLIERVEPENDDSVLDVACGTGIVARRVASRLPDAGTVVGLDINEAMLAVAEESAADVTPTIEWQHGDATDIPFPDASFDLVFCQQALQFVDDPSVALEEMHRILAPGGRLGVSVWRPLEFNYAYVVLADALGRHVGDEAATMMRSPFPDWDGDDVRSLVRDQKFRAFSVIIEIGSMRYPSTEAFVRREAASSPLAEPIAELTKEGRDDLVQEVEDGLAEYIDDEGIVFPMESYVLTAHR